MRSRPVLPGSSLYGARSAAPREPSAPSAYSLIARIASRPLGVERLRAAREVRARERFVGPRQHDVVAQRVAARGGELAVRVDPGLRDARLADRGEPPPVTFRQRREARAHELRVRRRRDRAEDQVDRVVDEDAGRRTVRVAQDAPARGIGDRCADARGLHRLRVREHGVAVDAVQHDGAIGDRGAERIVRRERLAGPEVLVPAVADDPRVGRRARERDRAADDLLEGRGVGEIGFVQRGTDRQKVEVRVDEPREHGGAAGIEHARRRAAERVRAVARAHVDETAVAHGERLHHGCAVGIGGTDRRRRNDQVGAALARGGHGSRRGCRRCQACEEGRTAHRGGFDRAHRDSVELGDAGRDGA